MLLFVLHPPIFWTPLSIPCCSIYFTLFYHLCLCLSSMLSSFPLSLCLCDGYTSACKSVSSLSAIACAIIRTNRVCARCINTTIGRIEWHTFINIYLNLLNVHTRLPKILFSLHILHFQLLNVAQRSNLRSINTTFLLSVRQIEIIISSVWYRRNERKDDDIYITFLLNYHLIKILFLLIYKIYLY